MSPAPAPTPRLAYSPLMDPADYSSDDGDTLQTPLQFHDDLPDYHPRRPHDLPHVSSASPSASSDSIRLPAAKYHLPPSHVSRPVSPLSPFFGSAATHPQERVLRSFSASPSLYDNALQLGSLPGKYPSSYHAETQSGQISLMSPSEPELQLPPDMQQLPPAPFPTSATPSPALRPRPLPSVSEYRLVTKATAYSRRFPRGHHLNASFVQWYELGDELGAGGYGFVMTARHRLEEHEVAVKFIIKAKVPDHAWMEDRNHNRVPTEALLLGLLDHPNIVRCLDLFEDELYFYLVQELHGTPWVAKHKDAPQGTQITAPAKAPSHMSTPALTPSPSTDSDVHLPPDTPPQSVIDLHDVAHSPHASHSGISSAARRCASPLAQREKQSSPVYLRLPEPPIPRPDFIRRPSHDLFECIEQSRHKRLSESQARFIFAQIADAVHYLDSQGVTHCDIKDENILVDDELNVKLVDFGSAVVVDPAEPRPLYTLFFGTTAYAASEVLLKKPYRAPPAEVWTLGVLLSYLLTGTSPFPTEQDAIAGRVVLTASASHFVSPDAEELMLRCLEPDPADRAEIAEVRGHPWLQGALDLPADERVLC
ncbi:kinase-like protein [Auriscalpium vulgare]|uniref:Kinase-like protein n=1 Tax=Auriscalpium vulgare TaxID=40419 RepID=A0ACB8S5R2_9AGAM|nr:kinase-like protein [Auriscalpium vulgare]